MQQCTKEAPKHTRPFKLKAFFSHSASFPVPWDLSAGEGGSTNAEELSRTFQKKWHEPFAKAGPALCHGSTHLFLDLPEVLSLQAPPELAGWLLMRGARQAPNTLKHGAEAQLGFLHEPALPVPQGHRPRAGVTGQVLRGWSRHNHHFIRRFHTFHLQVAPK